MPDEQNTQLKIKKFTKKYLSMQMKALTVTC